MNTEAGYENLFKKMTKYVLKEENKNETLGTSTSVDYETTSEHTSQTYNTDIYVSVL
jgi:hypothetical protein